jgi:YfiH family protein
MHAPAGDVAAAPAEFVFELPGGGRALFTTRAAGNLSTGAGVAHEHGLERRGELCERLGLRWLCSSRQVHGATVNAVQRIDGAGATPLEIDADGHATALAGVGTMVLAADCLPVLLGCQGVVAGVHAGWRGLAAGVLENGVSTVRALDRQGEIVAVIGPGAGPCCYQVGPEVHRALGIQRDRPDAIDLRAIARQRLLAAGVTHVREVDACTICDERFFSHRREGVRAGRQAGVAWLS